MPTVFSATAPSMPAFAASCPNQFVHLAPPQPDFAGSFLEIYLERLCHEIQAIRAFQFVFFFDRVVTVASLQE
ncbi:hypothetical protein ACVINW_007419 [Bradyrhizobium sp. USDA 4461]